MAESSRKKRSGNTAGASRTAVEASDDTALSISEERFRMLADNMSQLAWTCDLLGNVSWYNKRWLDYTGLSFEAMKGWDWTKVHHPDHVDRVVATVRRSGETGEPWESIFPLRGKDGEYRWFLSRAMPIRDKQGNFVQWFGTNTDITEQILAEEKVARQARELQQLNERLQELDRAKTAFFANVSHEFRTPLTLMLGPLEEALAAGGELPEKLREDMSIAYRNALRLLKLVNTLLDFSRLEAGRTQASYEPVDLASFTAELASNFRSAVERAGMQLVIDCPPLAEPVYVDREMWEKIVLNLLSNAYKFTFQGEIAVRVTQVGQDAQLTVSDSGTGIPDSELPHIFERFHRVRDARARSHEGSGIGLALVQELVRLHAGHIDVDSRLDQGTTFTVRIPTGTAHMPAERINAPRERASTAIGAMPFVEEALRWLPGNGDGRQDVQAGAVPELSPMLPQPSGRVLLADDNADMRDYVRRLLADLYEVQTVANGEAALQAALQDPPDLVLADIMMPGLDGLQLLRALRTDPRTRETPIVLLSARAGEESKVEGLDAGADDYLVKPFSARELLARVRAHVSLSQERRRANVEMRIRLTELEKANAEIRDARRATLNVLEDVVEARQRAERLYGEQEEYASWMRGQREALEAAVNGAPLAASLGVLVRIAVEALGPGARAAFYLADSDGKSLHHVVGMPADYAAAVDGFRIGPESLACGLATYTGEPVLTTDVQDDPLWQPWCWLAERFGYRGCWSFPINTVAGKFIGTLAFYSPQPRAASERDRELAALLTTTAAIILSRQAV